MRKKVSIISVLFLLIGGGCSMSKKKYLFKAQQIDSCNSECKITRSYDLPFIRIKGIGQDERLRRMSLFRAKERSRICISPIGLDSLSVTVSSNLTDLNNSVIYPGKYGCTQGNLVKTSLLSEVNNTVTLISNYDSAFIRFLLNTKFDGVFVYYNYSNKSWYIHHYYYGKGLYISSINRFGKEKKWRWLRFRNAFRYPIDLTR